MSSEKQYIQLFADNETLICEHSCPAMNAVRHTASEAFTRLGFPSRKTEEYKYIDVDNAFAPDYGVNVKRIPFALDANKAFRCSVPNMDSAVYFMAGDRFIPSTQTNGVSQEGVYIGSICDFDCTHSGKLNAFYGKLSPYSTDGIVALNTMLAQDGLLIWVDKGIKVPTTLQVINIGRSEMDLMTNKRVLIILEDNAEVSVLFCDHNMDKHRFLTTQVTEVFLSKKSHLSLCAMEETDEDNTLFDNIFINQQEDSQLDCGYFTLRNGVTRRTGHIKFTGENAHANIYGGVIGDGKETIDTNLLIDHSIGGCTSNVLFKYVLDDESVGAFAGKVLVREGAQKTDSQETNANLCVSPQARMYTQPMLEIYADDVKCNHGSTVGRLDEKALFYMAQRGIPEKEANILLQEAFLGDTIRLIHIEPLRERLTFMVQERFRHKLKGCGNCKLCDTK